MSDTSSLMPSPIVMYAALLMFLLILAGVLFSENDKRARRNTDRAQIDSRVVAWLGLQGVPSSFIKLVTILLREMDGCGKSRSIVSSLNLFFVAIDTLAFLADKDGAPKLEERAFSDWVEKYLDPEDGAYIYPNNALFHARCGLIEPTGEMVASTLDNVTYMQYSNNQSHTLSGEGRPHIEIVSIPVLLHDTRQSIKRFVDALQFDEQLLVRVQQRWPLVGELRRLIETGV
ncbi:MAG: hypothetical protein WAN35_14145 [Terracidiphilus sp.]